MSSEPVQRPIPVGVIALLIGAMAGCGIVSGVVDRAPEPTGPAFNHAHHLRLGIECIDCHEGAEDEAVAGMPDREMCWDCHEDIDEEKPPEKRIDQWARTPGGALYWNKRTTQSDEILFDHSKHAAADVTCTDCHGDMEKSERVTADVWQSMDDCMRCHGDRGAPNDCSRPPLDAGPRPARARRRGREPRRELRALPHAGLLRGLPQGTRAARPHPALAPGGRPRPRLGHGPGPLRHLPRVPLLPALPRELAAPLAPRHVGLAAEQPLPDLPLAAAARERPGLRRLPPRRPLAPRGAAAAVLAPAGLPVPAVPPEPARGQRPELQRLPPLSGAHVEPAGA
jgi:hypothetical protein